MILNQKCAVVITAGFFIGVLATAGCKSKRHNHSTSNNSDSLHVTVKKPVDRDFDKIKSSGVLRMITRYGSSSYFLQRGLQWGFEYELVQKFAQEHNLALQVVIVEPGQNPYDLLNSGKGDLIADNYTITPERKKYVAFTHPYNLVNEVVVFSKKISNPPKTLQELAQRHIPITVRRNSSYFQRLQQLRSQGYPIAINRVSNREDTESMLFQISRGKYEATVADDNIFQASNAYMSGLLKGPVIAKNDTIAWAVRKNATELKKKMDTFLSANFKLQKNGQPPKRSSFLNVLRRRYFKGGRQIANYYHPESQTPTKKAGIISPYDSLFKAVADSAGIDWLMVASVAAEETKFNPHSTNWSGAVGLMQVLPRYSDVPKDKLYNAKINVKEGVRIICNKLSHYSYMDSTDQWKFALASYNAGQGHVADARRLAIDEYKNPNKWQNAANALLKLMQHRYYKDARYGFCRGIQTVRYVQDIMNRHKTYQSIIAMANRNKAASAEASMFR